ncbi:hypothetical protein Q9966_016328 [Columba livia]|nr:hypothetical protein Q9966_016328 [Columba livia]
MALAELIELLSWILVMSLGLSQSAGCRASGRLGLSLELGELQGVLSLDSSRPVKFSVCKSIWETSDPFLGLVLEISVSDQVKKAETNRPVCSPVTGQESGCGTDLPTGSSTKVAAPKDSKLATLKSSLLASAALELNITMSPPPAMKLVLSAKNAAFCGRQAEVTIAHHLIHNLPTTPTPWTPPTPTPWPVGKSRLSSSALHWPNHEKLTFSFILSSALWLPASP